MRRRARVALAGLGRMGRIHAGNVAGRCPSAELACVLDVRPEVARAVGEDLGVPWSSDVEAALGDPGVDALAVATTTATHAPLVIAAATAGTPVFCEKPIALDRPSTVDALAAVRSAGTVLQVGFHRRFDPDWTAAAERITSGELGDVYLFRSSLRDKVPPDPAFLGGSGGFFVDMTIHDLDTARWMVGEVVEVTAHGAALSDPGFAEIGDLDTALVTLRFASGALGVIDNSRAAGYGYECSTEVVGRSAAVRIDAPHRRGVEWRTPGASTRDLVADFQERYPVAYAAELDAFARAVLDGTPPLVGGVDALAAYDLARAAERSWRTGRTVALSPVSTGDGVDYGPQD